MDRSATLELNARQRADKDFRNRHAFGRGTQTWGHMTMRIPEGDYAALVARNPRLGAKDSAEFAAAWAEFEKSDESLPYRVYHQPRIRLK